MAAEISLVDGTRTFANERVVLGIAWAQAGRDHMQDSFSLSLSCKARNIHETFDFFGVFDGHGPNGEDISHYVASNLSDVVLKHYIEREDLQFAQCVEMGCLMLDDRLRQEKELMTADGLVKGGTTACAVWVMEKIIYSGNVGDSRLILSYNGKAFPVSEDHKPGGEGERARIEAGGGQVRNNRVNGMLAVARAFGDFQYKKDCDLGPHQQLVIPLPDVRTVEIEDSIDFLVIASDGVWDLMTNQEVVDFILERMNQRMPIGDIGEDLIQSCKLPRNPENNAGSDNMTIIIAVLR